MHDAKGRPLKVGDIVLIPCRITDLHASPDFCNVNVRTLGGRAPDGIANSLGYLNTQQLLRGNPGDDTAYEVVEDDGKTFLR